MTCPLQTSAITMISGCYLPIEKKNTVNKYNQSTRFHLDNQKKKIIHLEALNKVVKPCAEDLGYVYAAAFGYGGWFILFLKIHRRLNEEHALGSTGFTRVCNVERGSTDQSTYDGSSSPGHLRPPQQCASQLVYCSRHPSTRKQKTQQADLRGPAGSALLGLVLQTRLTPAIEARR